jgi:hypothetical protein
MHNKWRFCSNNYFPISKLIERVNYVYKVNQLPHQLQENHNTQQQPIENIIFVEDSKTRKRKVRFPHLLGENATKAYHI